MQHRHWLRRGGARGILKPQTKSHHVRDYRRVGQNAGRDSRNDGQGHTYNLQNQPKKRGWFSPILNPGFKGKESAYHMRPVVIHCELFAAERLGERTQQTLVVPLRPPVGHIDPGPYFPTANSNRVAQMTTRWRESQQHKPLSNTKGEKNTATEDDADILETSQETWVAKTSH